MKKAIVGIILTAAASLAANATPTFTQCDSACQNNVRAVFGAGNLTYSLRFQSRAPARVSLLLKTSDRSDFAPLEYVGDVTVGLHSATLSRISFPDPKVDPCEGLIAVTDRIEDQATTYLVPVHNVRCSG
ncbi:hypothetical protein [Burkholderia sp. Ac-20365]|uniref:hypothetical protein n=1 Tax=Burkholderia sp. Ac-20365 TaxID=2703897 RepID=UPI00197C532F|nr:hypothetical protein [Burkholderia sp. Ac-20365]MBN3761212.1 hypothetical protein [Burkholderia sp. Ac-20365]